MVGLIPAWAGKTVCLVCAFSLAPAHPRVGGENPRDHNSAWQVAGSSPRGRGKPFTASNTVSTDGLIPAWAGKT